MSIYLGNKEIQTPTIGTSEISEIYYGNNLVYQSIIMPVKGDLITMTLGNTSASGTNNLYRVLKVNGTQAEVVAMYDYSTSCVFNSSSTTATFTATTGATATCQKYENSNLDTVLNSTFYSSLNSTAKATIVDKTFTQEARTFSSTLTSPYYYRYYNSAQASSAIVGPIYYASNSITRHVYALDFQDIVDYLGLSSGDIMYDTQVWQMFWNTTSAPSTVTYPWLRSGRSDSSTRAWFVDGSNGNVTTSIATSSYAARPAFTIDLSKIEWSKV